MKKELYELTAMKEQIETKVFQQFIVEPIKKELDKLKDAYDCGSLKELAEVKGKKEGLYFLIKLLKKIDTDYQNEVFESQDK